MAPSSNYDGIPSRFDQLTLGYLMVDSADRLWIDLQGVLVYMTDEVSAFLERETQLALSVACLTPFPTSDT